MLNLLTRFKKPNKVDFFASSTGNRTFLVLPYKGKDACQAVDISRSTANSRIYPVSLADWATILRFGRKDAVGWWRW